MADMKTEQPALQPALLPECLPPEPNSAVDVVARLPHLPTAIPDTWQEVETATRAWILEALHWAQELTVIATATGLPLTDWKKNDMAFAQQVDQAIAAGKIQIGVALIQAAVLGENRSLQTKLLEYLHKE